MSKRRRIGRERYTIPDKRDRREYFVAAGGALAVVVGTLALIWMLRPGTGAGTGGLMHRQPRAAWLAILFLVGALVAVAGVRRSRLAERGRVSSVIAVGVVATAAVAGGFLWPGGILRHPAKVVAPPVAPVASVPTLPGPTSVTGGP